MRGFKRKKNSKNLKNILYCSLLPEKKKRQREKKKELGPKHGVSPEKEKKIKLVHLTPAGKRPAIDGARNTAQASKQVQPMEPCTPGRKQASKIQALDHSPLNRQQASKSKALTTAHTAARKPASKSKA